METTPNIDKPFPVLSSGWRTAWDHRWPMALYTLIVWACGGIVLAPLVTWILRSLAGYGDVIVGNYTIHLWLLTPRGLAYLLLAGSVVLFTGILQLGGLLQIAGSSGGQGVSARDALLGLVANRRSLLKLSLTFFLLCLPVVLIIAAGPGLTYLLLLTEHDINFYLTHHPPQWTIMLVVSGVWVLITVGATLILFVRSMFALPAWLDGTRSARVALKTSWGATRGCVGSLSRIMLLCIGGAVLVAVVVNTLVFAAAGYLLDHAAGTLEGVVRIMSGHFIVHVLLQWGMGFLGVIWIAGVWAICYRRCVHADMVAEGTPHPSVSLSPMAVAKFALRLRVMIPVIAVLLLGSWLMSLWAFGQDVQTRSPLIIAHRAGATYAPENTLAALALALKEGAADIIEIDVTLTLDDELVVAHDKDLMKQAQDPRIIRETPYAELRTTDIGKPFADAFEGQRLERLEAFLRMTRGKRPMIVEFKHGKDTDLVERTVDLVRKLEMQDEVILMSLELEEVREVQSLAPEIMVGYFASVEMGDLRKLDVDILGLKDNLAEPDFVRDVQEQGGRIYAWTVDDPMRMVELMELGIDGIITNDPKLAADIVRRFEALKPEQRVLLQFRDFWKILKRKRAESK
jgi:glycerophosphoryl diester phosphodiesterase